MRGGGRRVVRSGRGPPLPSVAHSALPAISDSASSRFESRSSSRLFARALETTASATWPARKVWRYAWAGSAAPKTVSAVRPASLDFSVGGMRASCRLMQHPLLGRSLSVSQQSGQARQLAYSAPLLGKPSACSYLAAIPPGTASLRLPKCQGAFEQRGCSAPSTFSRLRLAEPSGRPGGSRPHSLPPAGVACVRFVSLRATPCPGRPASTLLCSTPILQSVPVREHRPAPPRRQCRAHKMSRSDSGRGCRLFPLRVRSPPLCRRAPKGSLRCSAAEPVLPHRTRPPPRPRSASLRALWHCQTLGRRIYPGARLQRQYPGARETGQHHRPTKIRTPGPQC